MPQNPASLWSRTCHYGKSTLTYSCWNYVQVQQKSTLSRRYLVSDIITRANSCYFQPNYSYSLISFFVFHDVTWLQISNVFSIIRLTFLQSFCILVLLLSCRLYDVIFRCLFLSFKSRLLIACLQTISGPLFLTLISLKLSLEPALKLQGAFLTMSIILFRL